MKARGPTRGEHGAAAILLLLALDLVSYSLAPKGCHELRHHTCPMRHPARAELAACAGHHSPPSQAQPAESCAIGAGSDCGGSQLPLTAHCEMQAVLPLAVAILTPDLASFPWLLNAGVRLASVRDLEAPLPQLLRSA